MTLLTSPLNWALLGLFLMLAEIIIPGGIVVFIGLGALLTAAALQLGFIVHWVHAFTLWFIASLLLLLLFRNVAQKMAGGDTRIDNTDEELDDYGKVVTVLETIGPGQHKGRIDFQGTSWQALGDGSEILAGAQVKIICRDNISIVVEPLTENRKQS
jgi:membrane protein implicated in regulation of membrane protease activity